MMTAEDRSITPEVASPSKATHFSSPKKENGSNDGSIERSGFSENAEFQKNNLDDNGNKTNEGPLRDPEEEARKVFVGNLSYKTTEESLRAHFSSVATIEKVILIRSRYRPLGYGFIVFESVEGVPKALELKGSKLHDRELNVEAITAQEKRTPRNRGQRNTRPRSIRGGGMRRGGGPRRSRESDRKTSQVETYSPNEEQTKAIVGPASVQESRRTEQSHRGRGRGRGYSRRARTRQDRLKSDQQPTGGEIDVEERSREIRNTPRAPPRHLAQARKARAQAARAKLEAEGMPSLTTVFVANLSYKVGDLELENIFKNLGIHVLSAKVIRANNGRHRGFGFVEFASDADQLRAVEEGDGLEADGRTLAVKIALQLPKDLEYDQKDNGVPEPNPEED